MNNRTIDYVAIATADYERMCHEHAAMRAQLAQRRQPRQRGFRVRTFAGIVGVVVAALLTLVVGLVAIGTVLPSPNPTPTVTSTR